MNAAVAVLPNPAYNSPQAGPFATPARSSLFGDRQTRISVYIPPADDDTAVLQTLDAMAAICRRTASSPEVKDAAAAAIAGLGPSLDGRGRLQLARAVWAWVRSHVRFVQDSDLWTGVRELLIEPPLLLRMPQPAGDCDDFTMLAASMLMSLGVPVEFVVIAADPDSPERFSHVYAAAQLESGSWLAIDASHGAYAGWQAPRAFRRLAWFVDPDGARSPFWCWVGLALLTGAVGWLVLGGRS